MGMMRWVPILLSTGCGSFTGDVSVVALDDGTFTVDTVTAEVDALVLDNCDGTTETVFMLSETRDLLASNPLPRPLPWGEYCGLAVQFATVPEAGALHFDGTTADGTPFSVDLSPGIVLIPGEFDVGDEDWIIVVEPQRLLVATDLDALGSPARVLPTDAAAATLVAAMPSAMWFGPVEEARDTIYVDVWPFPDIVFRGGDSSAGGDVEAPRGCNPTYVGPTFDLDLDGIPDIDDPDDDGDGIDDGDDPDRDGDGLDDATDPDRDGDGVDDGSDPDGGAGTSDGNGGGAGGGGAGSGGGSGDGCGGGGSSCGGDCCGIDTCSTVAFAPWTAGLIALVLLRRRRGVPAGTDIPSSDIGQPLVADGLDVVPGELPCDPVTRAA